MGAKVGLLVLVPLGMFFVFEAALRIAGAKPMTATALSAYLRFDRTTGWRGRPNVNVTFETRAFSARISHGPDGFRTIGRLLPAASADAGGSKEVWVLGDSFTWGWGVDDGRTYVDHLNRPGGECIYRNLGHPGFSAVQEYLLLRDLLGVRPGRAGVGQLARGRPTGRRCAADCRTMGSSTARLSEDGIALRRPRHLVHPGVPAEQPAERRARSSRGAAPAR